MIGVDAMRPIDDGAPALVGLHAIVNMDPSNDQDVFVEFNFTGDLSAQFVFACIDLARLPRAPEGSG